MPLYEYKCRECKKQFEILVSSKQEVVKCPSCNSPNTGKIISTSSYRVNRGSSIPAGALTGCSTRSGFS